ncbi:MAG: endonuclease/exonuclease/phosphatase family protein [Bacteroidales bacterium]|nr:endonuclease/exonuclease/phosphatase family protein [Bacteroidales bacterium]
MTDYKPAKITKVQQSESADTLMVLQPYSAMIWNIGYCGLDRNMDFFYDGGQKVRPTKEIVMENLSGIKHFIARHDTFDFFLFQELDIQSKRSYKTNQMLEFKSILTGYIPTFGKNYDVDFVPVPLANPMGNVLSGIVTYTAEKPALSFRYSYPGNFSWPTRLFMLDRCFMINRFPVNNGGEFLLINTHNSAFDDGGFLRKMQVEYLKEILIQEYEAGNYVVVGGDWNQCPPDFMPLYNDQPFDTTDLIFIPHDLMPEGWQWKFDAAVPTNRRVSSAYEKGKTLTTVIDFFLFSPNIIVDSVKTIDLGFMHADHHPVFANFRLKMNK